MKPLFAIVASVLLGLAAAQSLADADAAASDTNNCLSCHDFGPESPVHAVLAGSHGISGDAEAMAGRRGCPDCHTASADHADDPSNVSPGVSFGPRWSSSAAAQDERCLNCHEQDVASNWKNALHMFNNLTCVTCHDIHAWQDKVLLPDQQAQVCTTCHKAQKQGVHGMRERVAQNPPCTACHNPHDHESAEAELLENDSAGCRHCHDPAGLPALYSESAKARNYHKLMEQPGRSCLECHEGIAHAPADGVTAMEPQAVSRRRVTLFYPGLAHSEWLLRDHPGSQPLRQGRNCQQCHRGEEADMGLAQAGGFVPASREIDVAFATDGQNLIISLSWQGPGTDADIALMWDDGGSDAFTRGGCFAACHSDLPGMSRDEGREISKYLWASREQPQRFGEASRIRDKAALDQLLAEGVFADIWRLQLDSGKFEVAALLADTVWQPSNLIQIKKSYGNGRWTVALTSPMNNTKSPKPFTPDGKYTFGIALHGAGNPGGEHWVSLPLTMSFEGDETDFKVEQQ